MAVLCLLLAGSAPGTVLTAFPADASDEKPAPLAQTLSGSRTLPAADVRQQEETVSANSQFLRCMHYNERNSQNPSTACQVTPPYITTGYKH